MTEKRITNDKRPRRRWLTPEFPKVGGRQQHAANTNKKSNQAGFSLIELVVVVAVLAILAAIAIPAFGDISKMAKIATAKSNITSVVKECLVLQASGLPNPTIADIVSARSSNPYGDALGLNFGTDDGFTYDTDLNSQITLTNSSSCFSIAAKSSTRGNQGGSTQGILPHFAITYDPTTGITSKDCKIDGADTYSKGNTCNESAAAGSQW